MHSILIFLYWSQFWIYTESLVFSHPDASSTFCLSLCPGMLISANQIKRLPSSQAHDWVLNRRHQQKIREKEKSEVKVHISAASSLQKNIRVWRCLSRQAEHSIQVPPGSFRLKHSDNSQQLLSSKYCTNPC